MAVNGKAWAHGSATHPTRVLRNMVSALLGQPMISHANSATATTRGGSYGVVGGGDLLVTTTGALGYSVAAGRLVGPGTFATAQGAYTGYNDAAVTGSFGARDATNPRIDYVAYKVRDTDEDATGSEDDSIVVIAGTPAGSPVPPTVASSVGTLVILSEVLVPSVANGGALQFTDRRMFASALGGIIRCTSTTRPTGGALWEGLYIDESDTNRTWRYTGSAWEPVKGRFGGEFVNAAAGPLGAGVAATIGYTTETEDTDAYHTGTGTQIVVPTGLGGLYDVFVFVSANTAAMTSPGLVAILRNSSQAAADFMQTGTTVKVMSLTISLAAGDIIEVNITNASGTSQTFVVVTRVYRRGD